jgi:hypothetical protein
MNAEVSKLILGWILFVIIPFLLLLGGWQAEWECLEGDDPIAASMCSGD